MLSGRISLMQSARTRLDRFISRHLGISRRDVRLMLVQQRVKVDGRVATDIQEVVHEFSQVIFDEQVLQDNKAAYVMMNKPTGVVSATKDAQHKTVIDLLDRSDGSSLHIVGRLDLNSSGLLLLTNDGRWSKNLSLPEKKVSKLYRVGLEKPLNNEYVQAFAAGMYFEYEGITTRPAKLEIISDYLAEVHLEEGRYHQIKRMFGRFNNKVISLHRLAVGTLLLDQNLLPGQSRDLSASEVANISARPSYGETNL